MFDLLAVVTFLVALFIFFSVPKEGDRPRAAAPESFANQLRVLGRIAADPVFWRVGPMVAALSGTFIAIQTLWAGRWLSDVGGLPRSSVADVLLLMALGFVIGSLTTGWIADQVQRRGLSIELVVGLAFLPFAVSQILLMFHVSVHPAIPWILFGLTGQASNLGYATLAAHFGIGSAGRAQSTANLLLFVSAWALQWGMGEVLNLFPGMTEGTVDPAGYRWAFGIALALQVAAWLWYLSPKWRKAPAV
jgi:predicted MFS family arabinose efflux permease